MLYIIHNDYNYLNEPAVKSSLEKLPSSASTSTSTLAEVSFYLLFSTPPTPPPPHPPTTIYWTSCDKLQLEVKNKEQVCKVGIV